MADFEKAWAAIMRSEEYNDIVAGADGTLDHFGLTEEAYNPDATTNDTSNLPTVRMVSGTALEAFSSLTGKQLREVISSGTVSTDKTTVATQAAQVELLYANMSAGTKAAIEKIVSSIHDADKAAIFTSSPAVERMMHAAISIEIAKGVATTGTRTAWTAIYKTLALNGQADEEIFRAKNGANATVDSDFDDIWTQAGAFGRQAAIIAAYGNFNNDAEHTAYTGALANIDAATGSKPTFETPVSRKGYGFTGAVSVGYNWAVSENFLLGLNIDVGYDQRNKTLKTTSGAEYCKIKNGFYVQPALEATVFFNDVIGAKLGFGMEYSRFKTDQSKALEYLTLTDAQKTYLENANTDKLKKLKKTTWTPVLTAGVLFKATNKLFFNVDFSWLFNKKVTDKDSLIQIKRKGYRITAGVKYVFNGLGA